jgi:F0F1-type ATP synthase membrane subunit b/b'
MMIFQDVHTYLVISFLLTGWLVFKLFYKKFDNAISKDITDIRDLLGSLEEQKKSLEHQLSVEKTTLSEEEEHKLKAISAAKIEAKSIINRTAAEAADIVKKKQAELGETLVKMQNDFSRELRNKFLDATMVALVKKVDEAKKNADFQTTSINNSINALRELSKSA